MRTTFSLLKKPLSSLLLLLLLAFAAPVVMPALTGVAHAATQQIYIVQRGDTLYSIARRFGTTVTAIKNANNLRSDSIFVGQQLVIPGTTNDGGATTTYIVRRGDTLSSIARRFNTTVDNLVQLNNLRTTTIYVGQTLIVPTGAQPGPQIIVHRVQAGETLSSIARLYGTTVADIRQLNGLTSDRLVVGQHLFVPLGGSVTQPAPAQRVQFARGDTTAYLSGRTFYIQPYLLWAAAGQEMTVYLDTRQADAYITVLDPNGVNIAGAGGPIKSFTGRLPLSGDYTVQVISPSRALIDFNITFSIVTPTAPVNDTGAAVVQSLTTRVLESFPLQYQAVLTGYLPDACTSIASVTQVREGSVIRIQMLTQRPAIQNCIQVIQPFTQVVPLDVSGYWPGTYEVRVNNLSAAFTIR